MTNTNTITHRTSTTDGGIHAAPPGRPPGTTPGLTLKPVAPRPIELAHRGRVTLQADQPLDAARSLRRDGKPEAAIEALRFAGTNPNDYASSTARLVEHLRALRDLHCEPQQLVRIAATYPFPIPTNAIAVILTTAINAFDRKKYRQLHSIPINRRRNTDPPLARTDNSSQTNMRDRYTAPTWSASAEDVVRMLWHGMTTADPPSSAHESLSGFRQSSSARSSSRREPHSRDYSISLCQLRYDSSSLPDMRTVILMFRVCAALQNYTWAREIRGYAIRHVGPINRSAAAEYIVCLGKCGRAGEASVYARTSSDCARFRNHPAIYVGLFQAFLACDRMADAESLVVELLHSIRNGRASNPMKENPGGTFLDIKLCNAFLESCKTHRLSEKAMSFVELMRSDTMLPNPDAQTYSLLMSALCSHKDGAQPDIAVDRALQVVDQMIAEGIAPTNRLYNTLIRYLTDVGRLHDAVELYQSIPQPDHITFSHLMQGAAKTGDIRVAKILERDLHNAMPHVYPNYNYCKCLLEVVAKSLGVDAAFALAKDMSVRYADALGTFSDVGGREAIRMGLIHACGVVGDLQRAFQALRVELRGRDDELPGNFAPLYIATALMQVCLDCNAPGQALEVFYSMKRAGLRPNADVYEKLVHGIASVRMREGSDGGGGREVSTIPLPPEERERETVAHGRGIGRTVAENKLNETRMAWRSVPVESMGRGDIGETPDVCDIVSPSLRDEVMGDGEGDAEEPRTTVMHRSSDGCGESANATCMRGWSRSAFTVDAVGWAAEDARGPKDAAIGGENRRSNLELAMGLLREMHDSGAGRSSRSAVYVYNGLISSAARHGDLDLAMQIFIKMCRHHNPRVYYIVALEEEEDVLADGKDEWTRTSLAMAHKNELSEGCPMVAAVGGSSYSVSRHRSLTSRFDVLFSGYLRFPSATTGTYNAVIHGAYLCGRPDVAFLVYGALEVDQRNECDLSTLSLLADIGLEATEDVDMRLLLLLLNRLDGNIVLHDELKRKRGGLRKMVARRRWRERCEEVDEKA